MDRINRLLRSKQKQKTTNPIYRMNDNLCIALITTASIFAGFLVAFLSSYLTTRNRENDENRRAFDALGRKLTLFVQLMFQLRCLWLSRSSTMRRIFLPRGVFRGAAIGDFEAEGVGDVYLGSDEWGYVFCFAGVLCTSD